MIANFSPGNGSVAPKPQMTKFELLAGEIKLQLFATFNAVLNCWGMIGWWTTSIIPKKFKTAPKVPNSNLGFWALGATDLFPRKKLAIKKSPSLAFLPCILYSLGLPEFFSGRGICWCNQFNDINLKLLPTMSRSPKSKNQGHFRDQHQIL